MKPKQLLLLALFLAPAPASAQVRGDPAARNAAARLLEQIGGASVWRDAQQLTVEERVFLSTGEVARLRIWRDLATGSRRLERSTKASRFVEWLSPREGWEERGGSRRALSHAELAMELQGLSQEPYAVYRRLAREDAKLRVDLREANMLYVHDEDERVLCWFVLDERGAPISWANFWNGAINQHYYGPLIEVGNVRLPKWGVSGTGRFRFEYVLGRVSSADAQSP